MESISNIIVYFGFSEYKCSPCSVRLQLPVCVGELCCDGPIHIFFPCGEKSGGIITRQ